VINIEVPTKTFRNHSYFLLCLDIYGFCVPLISEAAVHSIQLKCLKRSTLKLPACVLNTKEQSVNKKKMVGRSKTMKKGGFGQRSSLPKASF